MYIRGSDALRQLAIIPLKQRRLTISPQMTVFWLFGMRLESYIQLLKCSLAWFVIPGCHSARKATDFQPGLNLAVTPILLVQHSSTFRHAV